MPLDHQPRSAPERDPARNQRIAAQRVLQRKRRVRLRRNARARRLFPAELAHGRLLPRGRPETHANRNEIWPPDRSLQAGRFGRGVQCVL